MCIDYFIGLILGLLRGKRNGIMTGYSQNIGLKHLCYSAYIG